MWVYNRCFEKISLPCLKILSVIWRVNITFYKKNYQFRAPDHIVCGWDSLWMRKLKTICLIVLSALQNGLWQKAELKWKFEKKMFWHRCLALRAFIHCGITKQLATFENNLAISYKVKLMSIVWLKMVFAHAKTSIQIFVVAFFVIFFFSLTGDWKKKTVV